MLHLKRVTQPYEWERCHITGKYIVFGDYYYWDDEDELVVAADVYHNMQKEKREAEWDYSRLNQAQSEAEYSQILKEKTRDYLASTLLDRKVIGKYGS